MNNKLDARSRKFIQKTEPGTYIELLVRTNGDANAAEAIRNAGMELYASVGDIHSGKIVLEDISALGEVDTVVSIRISGELYPEGESS